MASGVCSCVDVVVTSHRAVVVVVNYYNQVGRHNNCFQENRVENWDQQFGLSIFEPDIGVQFQFAEDTNEAFGAFSMELFR